MTKTATKSLVVTVHDWNQAETSVHLAEARRQNILLQTAPGAAAYGGPEYFLEIQRLLVAAHPDYDLRFMLDCGPDPAVAIACIAGGASGVILQAPKPAYEAVRDMADQAGVVIWRKPLPAIDLADFTDPEAGLLLVLKEN